jgi:hypothetical protein
VWYEWGKIERHTGVWLGKLKERDHPEDLIIDGEMILIYILKELDRMVWTECGLV